MSGNSSSTDRPLSDLLAELEAAVREGDRARAQELEQAIQRRLATEAEDHADVERRMRELMADLEAPSDDSGEDLSFGLELPATRGATPAGADRGVVYPVWFGTNRKPTADGQGFTGRRHDRTSYGCAHVWVPKAHRFGETGSSFWRRLLRRDLRDDRLRLQSVETQKRDAFFADLQIAMQDAVASGETPHAVLFIHGFNNSFKEAAIRAAQIGWDLKVPGTTAFFSWPSRGRVTAYPADEASIQASEPAITQFLIDFTAHCGAEKVHVIAHSMGNRGLLRALQRIAANAEARSRVKFGQIFLAAPDVDRDLFLDLARHYPQHSERTTLYASDGDKPVHASAKVHRAPRAGYFEPYTVAAGVDTVAVPDFDIDLLGHSYFAQAESVLSDINDLIRHNTSPARRQRIAPTHHDGHTFWRLQR